MFQAATQECGKAISVGGAQPAADFRAHSARYDWQVRENARARIRVLVKRILRKHGYPPDMQQRATELVLEQTEVLCQEWTQN